MTFEDHIKGRKLTVAEAARQLGHPHDVVRKWCCGLRTPRPINQQKIKIWSGGQVTAEDWLEAAMAAETPQDRAA